MFYATFWDDPILALDGRRSGVLPAVLVE